MIPDEKSPARSSLEGLAAALGPADPDPGQTMAGLFEAVCGRRGVRPALVDGSESISYARLEGWAGSLARRLIADGAGAVGVVQGYEAGEIAALAGAVLSGCTYVGLDPRWPLERLKRVAEQSGCLRFFGPVRHRALFEGLGMRFLDWGDDATAAPWTAPEVDDGTVACLCFTSGSSGTPKGVPISRRAIRLLSQGLSLAQLGEDARLLQTAPLNFDASIFEVWGALLNGGTLVLRGTGRVDSARIAEAVRRDGVNTLWLTASLAHDIIDDNPAALQGLRVLVLGGEEVSARRMGLLLEKNPALRLINGYGPTECTTFALIDDIGEGWSGRTERVPIGRPIVATGAYVLDEGMACVGRGVPGELYLGGDRLSKGYLGDPGLTAARFVPNPFEGGGSRLYRTGDGVRMLPDGRLEFLGRLDRQLKIRGHRVEPQEIQERLVSFPGMADAHVDGLRGEDGQTRLRAFLRFSGDSAVSADALRAHLAVWLPDAWIPTEWRLVQEIPRTASGKLDLVRLVEGSLPLDSARPKGTLPETETERALAAIFREVLKVEEVGVEDDFFALGGTSLSALRVVAKIRRLPGLDLGLSDFFDAPTIAGLIDIAVARAQASGSGEAP